MSTNPQELHPKAPSFKQIDAAVRTFIMEMEQENKNGVLPGEADPNARPDRIRQLVKIYKAIKPLLIALSTLALIPSTWRKALALFLEQLQAVADAASPDFKAGKDL